MDRDNQSILGSLKTQEEELYRKLTSQPLSAFFTEEYHQILSGEEILMSDVGDELTEDFRILLHEAIEETNREGNLKFLQRRPFHFYINEDDCNLMSLYIPDYS